MIFDLHAFTRAEREVFRIDFIDRGLRCVDAGRDGCRTGAGGGRGCLRRRRRFRKIREAERFAGFQRIDSVFGGQHYGEKKHQGDGQSDAGGLQDCSRGGRLEIRGDLAQALKYPVIWYPTNRKPTVISAVLVAKA